MSVRETTLSIATPPLAEPKPGSMGKKGPSMEIDACNPDRQRERVSEHMERDIHTYRRAQMGRSFQEYLHDPELTLNMMASNWATGLAR